MSEYLSEFITSRELALRVRRPLATVRYWRASGTGPRGARIGGRVLYRVDDVDAWIEEQYAQERRVMPRTKGHRGGDQSGRRP